MKNGRKNPIRKQGKKTPFSPSLPGPLLSEPPIAGPPITGPSFAGPPLAGQSADFALATADILLESAVGHHRAGQLAEAETLYWQVLQSSHEHPVALYLLGVIACQVGKDAVALELIDRSIRVNPGNADAHYSRGNVLYRLQQYEAAVESYSRAILLKPDHAEACNNRGSALHALKQYEAALESYDRAILLQPNYAEAYNNRGTALHALKRNREALESFDKAIVLKPDYAEAYSNRGDVFQSVFLYLAAVLSYDKAIQLNPNHAETYNNRGTALLALQQYRMAHDSYDKAVQLKSDYEDACKNRENALRLLNQYVLFRPGYEYQKEPQVFDSVVKEVARIAQIKDKTGMKAALDELPLDTRSHPAMCNFRNEQFFRTESSGKDLVFYCNPTIEIWNPQTAKTKGIGGSEEAIIWLSRLLQERGWNVTVYNSCGEEETDYDGVSWKPCWMWNHRDKQDVTVIWHYPQVMKYEINTSRLMVDLHDVIPEKDFSPEWLRRIDRIFVKSKFHRTLLPSIPDEKFVIVPNGIDAKLFEGTGERDPLLLINTSSSDRSLEGFVDCFAEIKKQVPNAKAQWAYGWDIWDFSPDAPRVVWKAKMQERMQELGIEELGRISHGEVAQLYHRANVFAYPSEMAEIDCISLSKAMAAGAIPVTTDFAAMGDKAGHGGVFIHSEKTKDDWIQPGQFHYEITDPEQRAQFVREVVKLLLNPPSDMERESMREWARTTFDWNRVADLWNESLAGSAALAGCVDGFEDGKV